METGHTFIFSDLKQTQAQMGDYVVYIRMNENKSKHSKRRILLCAICMDSI